MTCKCIHTHAVHYVKTQNQYIRIGCKPQILMVYDLLLSKCCCNVFEIRGKKKNQQYVIWSACLSVSLSICLSVCQTLSLLGTSTLAKHLVYFNDARWSLHI